MKFQKTAIFTLLLTCFSQTLTAQDLNGSWKGMLNVLGNKLNLIFHLDKTRSSMDSPDQGAFDIELENLLQSGDSISVKATDMRLDFQYDGKLRGDSLVGTFKQNGFGLPLVLHRNNRELMRPQTPKPPFPYRTKEVSFSNRKANAVLSGTLTYPVNYEKGRTPVVLMVTGSGLQDRNETVFKHQPFCVIADYLAHNGIASLRYDDRSFGKSTGNAEHATTFDFKEDARNGIEFLKKSGEFGKIGILGHSEGGTIAYMLGAEKSVGFIVSMAGMAVTGKDLNIEQNRIALSQAKVPQQTTDEFLRTLSTIIDLTMGEKDKTVLRNKTDGIVNKSALPESLKEPLREMSQLNDWLLSFLSLKPAEYIRRITCPVMAIHGSKDTQVPPEANLRAMKSNLKANNKHLLKLYPDLNHLMQHCQTGDISEYASIEETISPEVLADIAMWINKIK